NTKSGSSNYETTGQALLFSEYCIDSGIEYYYNDTRSAGDPYVRRYTGDEIVEYDGEGEDGHTLYAYGYGCQIFPNNYKYSTIRAYLNAIDASSYHCGADDTSAYNYSSSGFLEKAFTSTAQGRIIRTTVDNSTSSAVSTDGSTGDPLITRLCPDTEDKIFLLSLNEITNADYGFASSGSSDDIIRKKYRSDYANGRGVYTKSGYAHYLIRTPYSEDTSYDKQNFRYVKEGGNPDNYDGVTNTDKGIVPALWVYIGDSYTADTNTVSTDELYVAESTEATLASSGTRTLNNAVELYDLVSEGYNSGTYGPIIVTKGYLVDKDYASSYETYGEEIYLVTLSGTAIVDGQSTGVWTDLQSGFNGSSDYLTNVGYVITGDSDTYSTTLTSTGNGTISAGLPSGSKIIISGHSLGGMISQQASAEDAIKDNYEVLNVVTFGSPLLSEGSREGTLHRLCDRSDIVPFASGSLISSSDEQWTERECEDGAYGEEIYDTTGLIAHMSGAAADTRDTTGPHCQSYKRTEVWGDYDVVGELDGNKIIILDNSTKTFFQNPDLD
ncbi:MAG: lipase family protein, partial [Treponemataceae bacterium]|nr:lipase family protein [Treponemataceae bacterium]